eukprot:3771253-Prymnesium_polylepis.2
MDAERDGTRRGRARDADVTHERVVRCEALAVGGQLHDVRAHLVARIIRERRLATLRVSRVVHHARRTLKGALESRQRKSAARRTVQGEIARERQLCMQAVRATAWGRGIHDDGALVVDHKLGHDCRLSGGVGSEVNAQRLDARGRRSGRNTRDQCVVQHPGNANCGA